MKSIFVRAGNEKDALAVLMDTAYVPLRGFVYLAGP